MRQKNAPAIDPPQPGIADAGAAVSTILGTLKALPNQDHVGPLLVVVLAETLAGRSEAERRELMATFTDAVLHAGDGPALGLHS